MKGRVTAILLFCSLALWHASLPGWAQQAAKEKKPAAPAKQAAPKEKPAAKWQDVAPGVKVLKLWASSAGPEWPEIVILQLSDEKHKEMSKGASDFGNKHNLFSKPMQPGMSCVSALSAQKGGAYTGGWIVVIAHGVESKGLCASLPAKPM